MPSYPGVLPEPAESECAVTFQQMLKTLWNRKLTIIVSVVVCVAVALGYAKLSTPTYQSSALVQINAPSQTTAGSTSASPSRTRSRSSSSSSVQIAAAKALEGPRPLRAVRPGDRHGRPDVRRLDGDGHRIVARRGAGRRHRVRPGVRRRRPGQGDQAQIDKYTVVLAATAPRSPRCRASCSRPATRIHAANALLQPRSTRSTQTYHAADRAVHRPGRRALRPDPGGGGTAGGPTGLSKSKLAAIGLLAGLLRRLRHRLRPGAVRRQAPPRPRHRVGDRRTAARRTPRGRGRQEGRRSPSPSSRRPSPSCPRPSATSAPASACCSSTQQSPLLVITSPEPGDGKTFVTANLAASWALTRQPGHRGVGRLPAAPSGGGCSGSRSPTVPGLSDLIKANWKQAEPSDGGHERPPIRRGRPGAGVPHLGHAGPGRARPSRTRGDGRSAPTWSRPASTDSSSCPSAYRPRQPERALRQPGHAAGPRPAPPAGRHRPPRHAAGAVRARHGHPRQPHRTERSSWRPRAGPTARSRADRPPARGHRLPRGRPGHEPRPALCIGRPTRPTATPSDGPVAAAPARGRRVGGH